MDTDESPDLASRFHVSSIPVLMRFENGKQTGEVIGFRPEAAVRSFAGL